MNSNIKLILIVNVLFIIMGNSIYSQTPGYPVTKRKKPTALTIKMRLRTSAPENEFQKQLKFVNQNNVYKIFNIDFEPLMGDPDARTYSGELTNIEGLAELVVPNNRSYWDDMRFVNKYATFDLDVEWFEMWIEYGNRGGEWEPRTMIAYEQNFYLHDAGGFEREYHLDGRRGRKKYIQDYFGWSEADFNALSTPIKEAIYDLGKSGSSDSADSQPINPKYGLEDTASNYCGDFVSWYYYEDDFTITGQWGDHEGYVFDFETPRQDPHRIADHFFWANKRYDYERNTNQWYLMNPDTSLDLTQSFIPQPGDYFGRYEEHAMMLLKWDVEEKVAYVIDGPYPVGLRRVPVYEQTDPDYENPDDNDTINDTKIFMIGRYKTSVEKVLDKVTIQQINSIYWEYADYGVHFHDPIVIMGIPDNNGQQPVTTRLRNVGPSSFEFQIDEWDYQNGIHWPIEVDYLVYDRGCQVRHGRKIEAGKITDLDERWQRVEINHDFSVEPIVLAQCVTTNEQSAVVVRVKDVTTSSFYMCLQEEEASDGDHSPEVVHYLLVEPLVGSDETNLLEVSSNWAELDDPIGNVAESWLFGQIQTFRGDNPCNLRQEMITPGKYRIRVQEESSLDDETNHLQETVGVLRFYMKTMLPEE